MSTSTDLISFYCKSYKSQHTVRLSTPVLQAGILVRPLFKQASLDQTVLKNHQQVSNLLFLMKLLQRVVLLQSTKHVTNTNLTELPTAGVLH